MTVVGMDSLGLSGDSRRECIAPERTILPENLPGADAVYLVSSLRNHRKIEVLE